LIYPWDPTPSNTFLILSGNCSHWHCAVASTKRGVLATVKYTHGKEIIVGFTIQNEGFRMNLL
jgi:hypothetical protein